MSAAGTSLANVIRLTIYTADPDAALKHFDVLVARFSAADVSPPMTFVGVTRLVVPQLCAAGVSKAWKRLKSRCPQNWSEWQDSNLRPPRPERRTLRRNPCFPGVAIPLRSGLFTLFSAKRSANGPLECVRGVFLKRRIVVQIRALVLVDG
ncbi:RidA family protein [uncultured Nitratireductor sp.]|uniref:RidA family protein n=1 Tax=uncultured Nitratireductor sp. TaxID=520953 RepID=UPI0025D1B592|nr:RidA family protein [uncultured Nitratireductor sp.]